MDIREVNLGNEKNKERKKTRKLETVIAMQILIAHQNKRPR